MLLHLSFIFFSPCELQISDFENAAVCCFVVLLTRSILSYKWNLLMPISKVDENMKRAQKRDAVRTQKFWWRKDIFTVCSENKVDIFFFVRENMLLYLFIYSFL